MSKAKLILRHEPRREEERVIFKAGDKWAIYESSEIHGDTVNWCIADELDAKWGKNIFDCLSQHERLKADRDALLEALKAIHDALGSYPCVVDYSRWLSITGTAIAKAEGSGK